ncbi:hypothetical protein CTI12_AA273330 [Artemisia annua]|uniref:Uncharacterized protein n=1 Tax=Artemisia annua TaxID=35608 RepID=A0A2U1NF76_ARTAN|nr:hypothetical protein CTI12_AA273330 [Artemisia annua]
MSAGNAGVSQPRKAMRVVQNPNLDADVNEPAGEAVKDEQQSNDDADVSGDGGRMMKEMLEKQVEHTLNMSVCWVYKCVIEYEVMQKDGVELNEIVKTLLFLKAKATDVVERTRIAYDYLSLQYQLFYIGAAVSKVPQQNRKNQISKKKSKALVTDKPVKESTETPLLML